MKIKLQSYITRKSKKKKKKKSELSNSETIYLIRFPSYVTRFCFVRFFNLKFPSYEKLSMTSQFDLTWFYDIIIRNSDFQFGFLTREFQIPFLFPNFFRFLNIFLTRKITRNMKT